MKKAGGGLDRDQRTWPPSPLLPAAERNPLDAVRHADERIHRLAGPWERASCQSDREAKIGNEWKRMRRIAREGVATENTMGEEVVL